MARLLIVNGPNLNMLGTREPTVYGNESLEQLNSRLRDMAEDLGLELDFYQSNHEGDLIDYIHAEAPNAIGMVLNPASLTHYSIALRDAIAAVEIDTIEVHISNIFGREDFRSTSVIAPVCLGTITGLGFYGYAMALSYFADNSQEDVEE